MNKIIKQQYDKLTLDWDYYQLDLIKLAKDNVINLLNSLCNHITIYEGNKGLSIIGELNEPINFLTLITYRYLLADDIFRIRAELKKYYNEVPHRINRIWLEKNGVKKKILYSQKKLTEQAYIDAIQRLEIKELIYKKKQIKENEKKIIDKKVV